MWKRNAFVQKEVDKQQHLPGKLRASNRAAKLSCILSASASFLSRFNTSPAICFCIRLTISDCTAPLQHATFCWYLTCDTIESLAKCKNKLKENLRKHFDLSRSLFNFSWASGSPFLNNCWTSAVAYSLRTWGCWIASNAGIARSTSSKNLLSKIM